MTANLPFETDFRQIASLAGSAAQWRRLSLSQRSGN